MSETEKKKLLVLSSTYPRWKGDWQPNFVHELSKRLLKEFQVTVLCPREIGSKREEIIEGVKVIRYRYAPERWSTLISNGGISENLKAYPQKWLLVPLFMLAQITSTRANIKYIRPDAIHAHWIIPQGIALIAALSLSRSKPPFLLTSHGGDLFGFQDRMSTWLKKLVIRKAQQISVVSNVMKNEMNKLTLFNKNISIHPMGVDLESRFFPDKAIKREKFLLLFVGRLAEKKGLTYLFQALPEIIQTAPSTRLLIVGSGSNSTENNLKTQCMQLGIQEHVDFLGPIPNEELPDLYRKAGMFIAPFITTDSGDQEGLGLVVIEAIGCGCPVVVSDIPASRDVTQLFPKHELIKTIEPKTSAAITKAVKEIYQADYNSIEIATIKKLERFFSWPDVALQYSDLITEMRAKQ